MRSDIEIAQAAKLKSISSVAKRLGVSTKHLIPYGSHIAKLSPSLSAELAHKPNGKLILVTAISPTPAGEGKTTTTIGLADALCRIGKKAAVCIREPSLGPVFGIKGGATGGGYAQVVPMENINLHFTGDFHAITAANNLLAALIDNHIHQGNVLNIDVKTITWRRCMDMNDRMLRHATLTQKSHVTETGFDITVASEVMAIFCLAENLDDLKARLGEIQVAQDTTGKPILARHLEAQGAMTALLKDAFQPNLVQTLEHTPALVHGGPFANIAHGCNSVIATKTALKLADYVVTEAGFGADLGAEKFIDIKCRKTGLQPDAVVLVATIRALKYHGGCDLADLKYESVDFLLKGINNLKKHINNLHQVFGLPVTVAINHFSQDTPREITALQEAVRELGHEAVLCKHWARGARGAEELAKRVVELAEQPHPPLRFCYELTDALEAKIYAVSSRIYAASSVEYGTQASAKLQVLSRDYPNLPICIAKTQYSFSCDPKLRNAPGGHVLKVSDLRLSRGAGFIVVLCGDIMTMPGLPKVPASTHIDVVKGRIKGLS
jgi:formate--tetrahydrofolate ligase